MAPPRRIRRKRGEPQSLWDFPAALELLDSLDVKRSHAEPLLRALASKVVERAPAETWAEMGVSRQSLEELGFPRKVCGILDKTVPFSNRISTVQTSADGSTTKMVIELRDGHKVESVVMRHDDRTTICVSSQVGCQMGCTFCATGTLPIVGDLSAGEIVEQLLLAQHQEAKDGRQPVRNAVFMGMGEPLNNYDAVLTAVRTMTDLNQLGRLALPQSRVTISTVGVVPRMKQLVRDMPGLSLALSLHAPTQELREQIVPSAKHVSLEDLLGAMDLHLEQRTARAMVEYVLLAGVNDTDECATQLGLLLAPRARKVLVNLIPYNPGASSVPGGFNAPRHEQVERFQLILSAMKIQTRVRREMGQDIAGACGQLALAQTGPAQDVEDFVAWRRRQPKESKEAVSAECIEIATKAIADVSQGLQQPPGEERGRSLLLLRFSIAAAAVPLALAALWFGPRKLAARVKLC
eukprot:TRINITY_DN62593_c0_g1_i1.p1 TRINITY_DN62593_c0_g1~~TRINITY_DN62593_c0_g1_i1.p1  ORF type:complete len:472 (+),score=87.50 TRINITY_DN62593_c0_g1_i1:23-1417(+)